MKTSTFYSSAFTSTMAALIVACGGGGDGYPSEADAPTPPAAETRMRFEFEPGVCSFDNAEATGLAALQYPLEFARCGVIAYGNKVNGKRWPELSWPSRSAS